MAAEPDLSAYERIIVAFSGGKDSLVALLHLLALGVPLDRIELHHHDVDGDGPTFMDWPCTPAYVRAVADYLRLALYRSWRIGGFARELDRQLALTAPVFFETPDGIGTAGGGGLPTRAACFRRSRPTCACVGAARRSRSTCWPRRSAISRVSAAAARWSLRENGPRRVRPAPGMRCSSRTGHRPGRAASIIGARSFTGTKTGSGRSSRRRGCVPIRPTGLVGAGCPAAADLPRSLSTDRTPRGGQRPDDPSDPFRLGARRPRPSLSGGA